MTLEDRIIAITGNANLRTNLESGWGEPKYSLYEQGQRGSILTGKTGQQLIDWAIAQTQRQPSTIIQPPEIDLVHAMREEMVLETISDLYYLPREGETITTERGLYRVTKVNHHAIAGRIYLSVVEVNESGVGR